MLAGSVLTAGNALPHGRPPARDAGARSSALALQPRGRQQGSSMAPATCVSGRLTVRGFSARSAAAAA
eukprot:12754056-Alexandrium_andersonii.AAC.1